MRENPDYIKLPGQAGIEYLAVKGQSGGVILTRMDEDDDEGDEQSFYLPPATASRLASWIPLVATPTEPEAEDE